MGYGQNAVFGCCCTVGAVTKEMVKRYIEDQDDSPQGFKVWDERTHRATRRACLQADD